jgi:hypothetical protein
MKLENDRFLALLLFVTIGTLFACQPERPWSSLPASSLSTPRPTPVVAQFATAADWLSNARRLH